MEAQSESSNSAEPTHLSPELQAAHNFDVWRGIFLQERSQDHEGRDLFFTPAVGNQVDHLWQQMFNGENWRGIITQGFDQYAGRIDLDDIPYGLSIDNYKRVLKHVGLGVGNLESHSQGVDIWPAVQSALRSDAGDKLVKDLVAAGLELTQVLNNNRLVMAGKSVDLGILGVLQGGDVSASVLAQNGFDEGDQEVYEQSARVCAEMANGRDWLFRRVGAFVDGVIDKNQDPKAYNMTISRMIDALGFDRLALTLNYSTNSQQLADEQLVDRLKGIKIDPEGQEVTLEMESHGNSSGDEDAGGGIVDDNIGGEASRSLAQVDTEIEQVSMQMKELQDAIAQEQLKLAQLNERLESLEKTRAELHKDQ